MLATPRRRTHFSTALAQAQGIIPECLSLFEIWETGMSGQELTQIALDADVLSLNSERRAINVIKEGFVSRFLKPPHTESAPFLKDLFENLAPATTKEIILIYAARQHGIFFGFVSEVYWNSVRAGRASIDRSEIFELIDQGAVSGQLEKSWSEATRKRVSSYVMGVATDFDLLAKSNRGRRELISWRPTDETILYLAYDLHFLDLSDDQVVGADEWLLFGFERPDVIAYLNRLEDRQHLTVQDSGRLCRIEWRYENRTELNHAILGTKD